MSNKTTTKASTTKDYTPFLSSTREDLVALIGHRDTHLTPEEQECVCGYSQADKTISVDLYIGAGTFKHILELNSLCLAGKGAVVFQDEYHVTYSIQKSAIRLFAIRHTKEMTPEQRQATAERLRAIRKSSSTQDM